MQSSSSPRRSLTNQNFIQNPLYQSNQVDLEKRMDDNFESLQSKRSPKSSKILTSANSTFYSSIPSLEISQHSGDEESNISSRISDSLQNTHTASLTTSVINLVSTLIGAGILGIPYALSRMGWILGIFSLLISALLSFNGLHFLAECVQKIKHRTYTFYSIAEIAVPRYTRLIDFAIMLKGIGVASSYLIVVTDSLPKAFHPFLSEEWNSTLFENRFHCLLISYILVIPLSYLHHLESLQYSSFISLIMILFLVVLIVLYSFQLNLLNPCSNRRLLTFSTFSPAFAASLQNWSQSVSASSIRNTFAAINPCQGKTYFFPFLLSSQETDPVEYHVYDIARLFPIFLFSFTCHQNTYNIISELERPTSARINSVFTISILTTSVLFLLISVCAYFTFGDLVASDVLKSYPVVITHYPLQLFASRKCGLTLWQSLTDGIENPRRFFYFSILFNIITFLLAYALKDLGVVFSLLGTITSTLVILLLPSIFYLQLFPDGPQWKRLYCKVIFAFGCLLLLVSLTFNILNASQGTISSH